MRVGVNTLFLIPGEVGGSETYLRRVLAALGAADRGLELVLFTHRENDGALAAAVPDSVERVCLPFNASNRYDRIVREQVQLPAAVRAAGVDVLWSPGYTSPGRAPCPMVTSILDLQYKSHPEDLTFTALWATRVLVALAARRSRLLLTISEFSKRELVDRLRVSPERIRVTPLAAGPPFDGPAVGDPATAVGSEGPYLLVVSNTYPHKNVEAAVEAFGRVSSDIPHRLVILGRPRRGEEAVRRAMRALPDPSRVERREYVQREALAGLYQGADAFVFPSRYEGFGLPVLEAMAAGVPVVTTQSASIPEVGGRHAVYAERADAEALAAAVREVLAWSPEQRQTRIEAARTWAGRFSWDTTARLTAAALRAARS